MKTKLFLADSRGYADHGWLKSSHSSTTYTLKNAANGLYLFVIEGEVMIEGENLGRRDAIGITDANNVTLKAQSNAKLLAIEVPLN